MRGNETLSTGPHSLVSWRSALPMDRNITSKPWAVSANSVNYYNEPGSGMKDVHSWLKSLRLHKYSELFSSMNYHQMMSLTEDELESKGVTKGARHKIILNITKLKNRVNNLKALEQSLGDEGPQYVRQALNELKALLTTPIRAYNADGDPNNNLSSANMVPQTGVASLDSLGQPGDLSVTTYSPFCDFSSNLLDEDDLPGHITHVLSKICSIILANPHLDDECLRMYAGCAERCLSHEAFTVNQKQQLCMYKQQVEALRCSSNGRRQANARQPRNWGTSNPFHENSANLIRALVSSGQFSNQDNLLLSNLNVNRRSKLTGGNLGVSALCNCKNAPKFDLSNPGFPGMERELVRARNSHNTRSSPHPYFNRTVQTKNSSSSPRHIPSSGQFMSSVLAGKELDPVTYNDSYLESLCIRMTEKVIGGVIG